jgi:hypothetical protein
LSQDERAKALKLIQRPMSRTGNVESYHQKGSGKEVKVVFELNGLAWMHNGGEMASIDVAEIAVQRRKQDVIAIRTDIVDLLGG